MQPTPQPEEAATRVIDLRRQPPPPQWGVEISESAIEALAERWESVAMPLPAFDYPGTPVERNESDWFNYVTLAVSILACLWPPEGEPMWSTEAADGERLDDAPGIFAAMTRHHPCDLAWFADLSVEQGAELFAGDGVLQLIPERVETLRLVARALLERWDGNATNLVAAADRHASTVAGLLTETVPGYQDRPATTVGVLPFDKLSHLAAAIMAAGVAWTFTGYDDFPVYPDYMLPRVFRHFGVIRYDQDLAAMVDLRRLIKAGSDHEHAIRWATVFAGARLKDALTDRGNPVLAPGLDYHLWSQAVLGPQAGELGEHHRTVTMRY